MEHSELIPETR